MSRSEILRRALGVVWSIVVVAVALVGLTFANGMFSKYYEYGMLRNGDGALHILAADTLDGTYVLLDIVQGQANENVIFEREEWNRFLYLWIDAKQKQSPSWVKVGAFSETDAKNTRVFVLGGPGVRFVIRQNKSCVAYDVPPDQFKGFEDAAWRVADHFSGKITGKLILNGRSLSVGRQTQIVIDNLTSWPPPPPDLASCR